MMEIRCCGASADCIAAEVLTSGMTGKQVRFAFDETWGGLSKTAVFVGAVKESVQLEQETVEIPASVLAVAGVPLVIGVRGESEDGALVIPTVYARCGMILPGADTVPAGAEVTPSQAQQLQSQIDELKKAGGGEPSGGAVSSVNGQTGTVVLNAEDVGALPDTTQIPAVPAALPNPNKLTFTGAVSAEYDGSAAVSVEIPEGGGGDETLVYAEEQLATGTIASDSTGQKLTNVFETGLTLGNLKQWKAFVFKLRGAANADPGTSYLRLMNTNYGNDYNAISLVRSGNSGTCAVFEWADTARTVLKVVSGFIGTNSYVVENGSAFASNINSSWTIVPVNSAVARWVDLRNCADTQVLAVTKSAAATDYLWEIRGLVK